MADTEVKYSPFPAIYKVIDGRKVFLTKEEIASPSHGRDYGKAIWSQYISNPIQNNLDRQRIIINRQYAAGLPSIQKYKDRKGLKGTSNLNLDFNPVNIIATKVDDILGKLMKIRYKVQCNSISPESKTKFDDYKNKILANMYLRDVEQQTGIGQRTGLPIVPRGQYVPENDDELSLHLKLNYREDISIAMEEALTAVFNDNDFEDTKEATLRDLIVNNKGCIGWHYDNNKKIVIDYIDIADIITPYSKYPDYRNIPYFSWQESLTVGQLAERYPELSEEDLFDIARKYEGATPQNLWNNTWGTSYEGYYNSFGGSNKPYYNFNIKLLNFWFKSPNVEKREVVNHRNRTYVNNVKDDKKVKGKLVTQKCQYLYHGVSIPETEWLFGYGMVENIERDKNSPDCQLPFAMIQPYMYDMQNKGLVERMIPCEDQINLANLGVQALNIKMKFPGIAIDIVGLVDAAKGLGNAEGGALKPLDIIRMYQETGNYVYSSQGDPGGFQNNKAITELRGGLGDVDGLMRVIQFYKLQMNEVIGDVYAATVQKSPSDQLVGVQDKAIEATNNALATLYGAFIKIATKMTKRVSLQIQDCIEYDNQWFYDKIGKYSTELIKLGKSVSMAELAIEIELLPDESEMADLLKLIDMGLEMNPPTLYPSDAIRIKQQMKTDIKAAGQLLVMLEDKNKKEQQQAALIPIQENAKAQQQSNAQAAQAKQQELEMTLQIETKKMQTEYQLKDAFEDKQFQRAYKLQQLKNEGVNTAAEIANNGKFDVAHETAEAKKATALVESNTQITKEHIVHHSAHTQLTHEHANAMEQSEQDKRNDLEILKKTPKPTKSSA